jgi:hypothetical protein
MNKIKSIQIKDKVKDKVINFFKDMDFRICH